VLLIWGSFVPVLFYGFRRENAELMRAYWTMVSQVRSDLETAI
jgi:adiponectin receptor